MNRNTRLLIIDDNPTIHEDFRKILAENDETSGNFGDVAASFFGDDPTPSATRAPSYQLRSAYQGQEGFELVREAAKQGQPFSVAFVDVRMPPGWDGVETTARLWEVDPDLQVVICTAYSDYDWNEMLEKLGETDRLLILKKPFDAVEAQQLANSLTKKWQFLQDSKGKMASLEDAVTARTAQLAQEQEKFKAIFENSPEGIFQVSVEGRILSANPALADIFGYVSPAQLCKQVTDMRTQIFADPDPSSEFRTRLDLEGIVRDFQWEIICKDGSRKWVSETACKVCKSDGSLQHYQGFVVDISAQKTAQKERDRMETHLLQARKLESVGQLAAGIAHEINTPMQFIGDFLRFIQESFDSLGEVLHGCQKLAAEDEGKAVTKETTKELANSSRKVDLEYIRKEIPTAIHQSLEGVGRVTKIVRAMKEFSHPGIKERTAIDLRHAIETTIIVASSEWKYVAEMVTEFDPQLPSIPGLAGEMNQVFLNLIVNASHAIGDVVKKTEGNRGLIKISTRRHDNWAEIQISDTGAGIPEAIRHRIFDPFFTTKEVGKGTGQGLAIAWSTVVEKHHGRLTFESAIGQGTTFTIRLPIRPEVK